MLIITQRGYSPARKLGQNNVLILSIESARSGREIFSLDLINPKVIEIGEYDLTEYALICDQVDQYKAPWVDEDAVDHFRGDNALEDALTKILTDFNALDPAVTVKEICGPNYRPVSPVSFWQVPLA